MTISPLRVGLDLDGSLESMGNSMLDLAGALDARDDLQLVRFRSVSSRQSPDEARLAFRALWSPFWRRSRGRAIDTMLERLDVVHVAGASTPPTKEVPLLVSVDDLRPLREHNARRRIHQLQRAVARGAVLVVSSRAARHEVKSVLSLERAEIVVVRPPVGHVGRTTHGSDLVVSLTGDTHRFLELARQLEAFVQQEATTLRVVASAGVLQRLRSLGVVAEFVERRHASETITRARVVVSISDGARFPSFAVCAMGAGVPTVVQDTPTNRELLSGGAALVDDDRETIEVIREVWTNDAARAILTAAGIARATDFSPWNVASAYASLYADVSRRRYS